jgi:phenylpropionate dioxygenase-like ring-hydroxylating dioxygenase large terminal subunit
LSRGTIRKDSLQCCFHGFRFSADGICRHVPEIRRDAPGLKVRTFASREKYGFIWIWWPEGTPESGREPAWFDEIKPDMAWACLSQVWESHVTRCIENQLDYAHLPFLHRNSIGRGFDPAREAIFDLADDGIRFYFDHGTSADKTVLAFRMPNVWINKIPSRYVLLVAFAPVDERRTKMYVRTYQNLVKIPVVSGMLAGLLNQINRFILREDRIAVETHPAELSSHLASSERLFPSDKGIRHFRSLWSGGIPKQATETKEKL